MATLNCNFRQGIYVESISEINHIEFENSRKDTIKYVKSIIKIKHIESWLRKKTLPTKCKKAS